LLTMITLCNDGTTSDSRPWPSRSRIICSRRGIFDRGSFRGRLVSAPIMSCEALRWFNADTTWGALKAGFKGTYTRR
jgi:hypothetical protein